MRIVFFGTPDFARTILAYLLEQRDVEVVAVVSRPDKARGRSKQPLPPPVKELALAHNLPVYQPTKASSQEFADLLKSLHADFFVVAAYAEILKNLILDIPRLGCLNVHASILPKYRGAAPIQRSIMDGEKETGITIMKMALKMDAGDIFSIRKTEITPDMTAGELTEILADLGKTALLEVLQGLEKGEITGEPQDPAQVTFAPKLTSEDGKIDWSQPCSVVYNHIRGVTPKPGAWCWAEIRGVKKRLLIKKASAEPSISSQAGFFSSPSPTELLVGCKEGSIRLLELQIEGKKSLSAADFLRGFSADVVTCL